MSQLEPQHNIISGLPRGSSTFANGARAEARTQAVKGVALEQLIASLVHSFSKTLGAIMPSSGAAHGIQFTVETDRKKPCNK